MFHLSSTRVPWVQAKHFVTSSPMVQDAVGCFAPSPLLVYFVSAGAAGAGVTIEADIQIFQTSPSRTTIFAQ